VPMLYVVFQSLRERVKRRLGGAPAPHEKEAAGEPV
jgi:hypothetical protein